ncbi:hypothetical protein AHF37_07754 [Paragonimus kellicotti]|nr:hypothetical protein AHF37_07754 [Paragonimus kellicotti]
MTGKLHSVPYILIFRYYYRRSKRGMSRNWLIFLEGGWYCFDNETCQLRESSTFALFSSNFWPRKRAFDGILSISPVLNPLYHDYNSVFIPYCSSDLWTGKRANRSGGRNTYYMPK